MDFWASRSGSRRSGRADRVLTRSRISLGWLGSGVASTQRMREGDGESRYARLESENERLREARDEVEVVAWAIVGDARELGRTLATQREEPFGDSDLIPDKVRQLQAEVRQLRRDLRNEYPRARRAEEAEHQRDECFAVLRLVADGEDAREIARALIAKWAAPRRRP